MHKLCPECTHCISVYIPQAETWLKIGETSMSNFWKFSPEIQEAKNNIKEYLQYEKDRLDSLRSTERAFGYPRVWAGKVTRKIWTRPDNTNETQWVLFPFLGSLTTRAANAVALEAARISIIENMVYNYGGSGLSIRTFLTTIALWEARSCARSMYRACVSRPPHGEITDETRWHMSAFARKSIVRHNSYADARSLLLTIAASPAALRDDTYWM